MEQETERINELKQELDKIERLKSLNELVKEKKLRLENEVYNLNYTEKDLTKKLGIKKT